MLLLIVSGDTKSRIHSYDRSNLKNRKIKKINQIKVNNNVKYM